MYFLKQYTYLFSVLAYCACVFPVIIHAGSLFFALKHVFSDLLYIPNYDFWVIRMCFLLFFTYLIPVFELSACISWFFAHTSVLAYWYLVKYFWLLLPFYDTIKETAVISYGKTKKVQNQTYGWWIKRIKICHPKK